MPTSHTRPHLGPKQDRSDQAERWFELMGAADCTDRERAAFARWRAEHPNHAVAYERVEYLYRRSADLRHDPYWRRAAQAARQRTARTAKVRSTLRWSLRWGAPLTTAAVLALAVGLGLRAWDPAQPELRYATAVGERHTVTLDDDSQVVLDTDTALAVRYSRRRRNVVLERGRAQFSVAPQPRRPFVVHAGAGTVRAVGTDFQVRRDEDTVFVTLLEGVVTVSATATASPGQPERTATLAPGEQLSFDGARLWAKHPVDLEAAEGWTRGELMFDRRPLGELIEEMNRYTTVKLRLGDPSLADVLVSGAFYDNDQSSLIQVLEQGWLLRAERVSEVEIVLRRRD